MMSDRIPSVLVPKDGSSSISTERALNQIRDILNETLDAGIFGDGNYYDDRIRASIDDVETMLDSIER